MSLMGLADENKKVYATCKIHQKQRQVLTQPTVAYPLNFGHSYDTCRVEFPCKPAQ
jgi:hypothetical protein